MVSILVDSRPWIYLGMPGHYFNAGQALLTIHHCPSYPGVSLFAGLSGGCACRVTVCLRTMTYER